MFRVRVRVRVTYPFRCLDPKMRMIPVRTCGVSIESVRVVFPRPNRALGDKRRSVVPGRSLFAWGLHVQAVPVQSCGCSIH